MTTLGTYSIPVRDVLKDITLTIKLTGLRQWRFRLWLGRQLIKLAAWVMQMGTKIEIEDNKAMVAEWVE